MEQFGSGTCCFTGYRPHRFAFTPDGLRPEQVQCVLGRQIRRNKTRLEKAKKVDPNIDFPDALYDEPDEEIHVVRTKSFYVKVMTPEEAILQMNMLGHQFFMFRDDSTGEINVVYRRKDGDYGLLVPESK